MKKTNLLSRMLAVGSMLVGSTLLLMPIATALTISPPIFELTGDPGTSIHREIELTNEEDTEKTFFISFENFEAQEDGSTPNFIGAEDGLATWLSSDVTSVELSPQEKATVPFEISIPSDANPGGYFAAVFFSTTPPDANGGVSVSGRVGSLVLLRVSGDIDEDIKISEFNAEKLMYSSLPVDFSYTLSNGGGSHIKPSGELVVSNLFRKELTRIDANEAGGNTLPGSQRNYSVEWPHSSTDDMDESEEETEEEVSRSFFQEVKYQLQDFRFGYYRASVELTLDETEDSSSTGFLVIPWQTLLCLLVLIGGFWGFLKFYKKQLLKGVKKSSPKKKKRSKKK